MSLQELKIVYIIFIIYYNLWMYNRDRVLGCMNAKKEG